MTALLLVSIVLFVTLIQRVGMLQVNRMLIFTADQGRKIIENLYPPLETPPCQGSTEIARSRCLQTVLYHGRPSILQEVNIPALVEIASRNGYTIELVASVGDAALEETPIVRVLGVGAPISEGTLRSAIRFGGERTFTQDPKYAIRLLVDIAIKALSPAINDPSTAVQALDQIQDLLIRLGRRRLEIGSYRDAAGNLRLVINFPTWDDFLGLAFDEIRFYGATSIQVMRRMKAVVNELISILPQEHPHCVIGRKDCNPRSSARLSISSTNWTPPLKTVRGWALRDARERAAKIARTEGSGLRIRYARSFGPW